MELRDLRAFIAVAEELHFGRAAKRLGISAPPLTYRIKNLEAALGVTLFLRTKRSVALTSAGAALLDDARLMLDQASGLSEKLKRAERGETGLLRAGVIGASVFTHARQLQGKIAGRHPEVHLEWRVLGSSEQIAAIRNGKLDFGLINTPIDLQGLSTRVVQRETLVAALSDGHPLCRRASLPLRALEHEVFIFSERHLAPNYYDRFISACNAAGFSPYVQHQVSSILAYVGLVAMGAGVSLVPASLICSGLAGVRYVPLQAPAPTVEVSLAWNPGNSSPILAQVLRAWPEPGAASQQPDRHRQDKGRFRAPRAVDIA
jgi:DNA-binding transcriptional LysR family regulator